MLGRTITGFEPGVGYFLFACSSAASLCGGYVLLGATWLVLRTEGALQHKALAWARWGLLWVALGVALVSASRRRSRARPCAHKWFDFPRTLALMLLPLASAAAWLGVWRSTRRIELDPRREPPWAAVRRCGDDLRSRLRRARLQPVPVPRHRPDDDLAGGHPSVGPHRRVLRRDRRAGRARRRAPSRSSSARTSSRRRSSTRSLTSRAATPSMTEASRRPSLRRCAPRTDGTPRPPT